MSTLSIPLYHGGDAILTQPKLLPYDSSENSFRYFCTSSDSNTAAKQAFRKCAASSGAVKPVLNIYDYDMVSAMEKHIRRFSAPVDGKWLDYAAALLRDPRHPLYDIVLGPPPTEENLRIVRKYISGALGMPEALERINTAKPDDCFSFFTEEGLSVLRFVEYLYPMRSPLPEHLEEEVNRKVRSLIGEDGPMGYCHIFWREKKRILRDEYRIDWKTPAEEYPGVIFD